MAHRLHLIRVSDPASKTPYQAWCGYESSSKMFMTSVPTGRLCTKCSTKYNADQLKQHPIDYHLGDRLDLTKDNRRHVYKSVYPILTSNDVLIGYLIIEHGWGKHWHICPLTVKNADVTVEHPDIQVAMGGRLERHHAAALLVNAATPNLREALGSAGTWLSKEAALQAVPSLVENGLLKSAETVLAEATAVHAELHRKLLKTEAHRQQVADERKETMERIRVGFAELLATDVSNFQRSALLDAAKLLGVALGVAE